MFQSAENLCQYPNPNSLQFEIKTLLHAITIFFLKKVKNESADYLSWILRVMVLRTEYKYFHGIYDEINFEWSGI